MSYHNVELRKYFKDTRDPETGTHSYQVMATGHISEHLLDSLKLPKNDDPYCYYEWVFIGSRAERYRQYESPFF